MAIIFNFFKGITVFQREIEENAYAICECWKAWWLYFVISSWMKENVITTGSIPTTV